MRLLFNKRHELIVAQTTESFPSKLASMEGMFAELEKAISARVERRSSGAVGREKPLDKSPRPADSTEKSGVSR